MLAGEREILARPFASERILLSHLLFADGWRYRLREVRRQWTSVHDQQNVRLPDGLAFLYHLIRAPLWLWRRIRRP